MSDCGTKLRKIVGGPGSGFSGFVHWCPACQEVHQYATENQNGPKWTFNGNFEQPSFTPSMLIRWGRFADPNWKPDDGEEDTYSGVCHYFITDGKIAYCGDCTHAMKGQTVDLPDWPHAPGSYGGIQE